MIVKLRRSTENEYNQIDIVLAENEPAVTLDSGGMKVGDGVTPWHQLEWTIFPGSLGGVPDWMFEGLNVIGSPQRVRSTRQGESKPA